MSVIFFLGLFNEAVKGEFVGNKSSVISGVTGALRQQQERKRTAGIFTFLGQNFPKVFVAA